MTLPNLLRAEAEGAVAQIGIGFGRAPSLFQPRRRCRRQAREQRLILCERERTVVGAGRERGEQRWRVRWGVCDGVAGVGKIVE